MASYVWGSKKRNEPGKKLHWENRGRKVTAAAESHLAENNRVIWR
jgi:hypothetical protein